MRTRNAISAAVAAVVSTAFLTGCETTTETSRVAFDHPKASQDQLLKDRYACIKDSMGYVQSGSGYVSGGYGSSQSQGAAMVNGPMYNNCMALKGYTLNNESGRLVVPPELYVRSYGD